MHIPLYILSIALFENARLNLLIFLSINFFNLVDCSLLECLGLVATICAVLIPTPLMEFRYYTLPVFFSVLFSHSKWKIRNSGALVIGYVIVNALTLFVFLYRPFEWAEVPLKSQRFMW